MSYGRPNDLFISKKIKLSGIEIQYRAKLTSSIQGQIHIGFLFLGENNSLVDVIYLSYDPRYMAGRAAAE